MALSELSLFTGAGGGLLGTHLLGWRPVCAVEIEPYCREILLRRQRDGVFPLFPIWDDIKTFDGRPWRGLVDVVTGGFPCQPYSVAGKNLGRDDPRNMWPDTIRVIREVVPQFCFLENVPGLLGHSYFGTILGDLVDSGYNARWVVLGAEAVGAPHGRRRLWVAAELAAGRSAERTEDGWICRRCTQSIPDACSCYHGEWQCRTCGEWTYPFCYEKRDGCQWCGSSDVVDAIGQRGCSGDPQGGHAKDAGEPSPDSRHYPRGMAQWDVEPPLGRVANGLAHRAKQLAAIGNGQVPAVVAEAWRILKKRC